MNTVNLNNLSPVKQSPDIRLRLRKVNNWTSSDELPEEFDEEEIVPINQINDANVICSDLNRHWNFGEDVHIPVLDIDRGMVFWESSTPGHYSVIFKTDRLTKESYFKLLDVMVECGILEEGYVNAAKQRGYTAVRLPWVKKGGGDNQEDQEAPY